MSHRPGMPERDIFSPVFTYPLFVSLFLLFGVFGLDVFSFLLFILFLGSYLSGIFLSRRAPGNVGGEFPWIWRLGLPLIITGVAAGVANMAFIGAVPLFKPALRSEMIPALTYISFLILPGCVIKSGGDIMGRRPGQALLWFLLSLFAISLLGYKTEIFALVISMVLMLNYLGCLRRVGKRAWLLLLGLAAVFLVSGITVLRFSLTAGVFSSIVSKIGPLGITQGMMFQSIFSSMGIFPGPAWGPRGMISQLVGMGDVTTTPTILGIPYMDFGVVGVVATGIILGLLFGAGYQTLRRGGTDILPLHAVCLSFLILTIETGIADLIVILYLFAYLLMILGYRRAGAAKKML